jgi:hypothetical protein
MVSAVDTVELKDRVRRRHPATQAMGVRTVPGPWTVIEEVLGCDLVAFAATADPAAGHQHQVRFPRVGYELKVSRADMRRELLNPSKRLTAVSFVHEFYIATPAGLLKPQEKEFVQPDWTPEDFRRPSCTARCRRAEFWMHPTERKRLGVKAGQHFQEVPFELLDTPEDQRVGWVRQWSAGPWSYPCPTCEGRGYSAKSVAEREAPNLWIPPDVGLVEVDGRGCRIIKPAPINKRPAQPGLDALGDLIRFVSAHPDPRHVGLVERDRELYKELRKRST